MADITEFSQGNTIRERRIFRRRVYKAAEKFIFPNDSLFNTQRTKEDAQTKLHLQYIFALQQNAYEQCSAKSANHVITAHCCSSTPISYRNSYVNPALPLTVMPRVFHVNTACAFTDDGASAPPRVFTEPPAPKYTEGAYTVAAGMRIEAAALYCAVSEILPYLGEKTQEARQKGFSPDF